jgi:septation ring formation regulator EzrA
MFFLYLFHALIKPLNILTYLFISLVALVFAFFSPAGLFIFLGGTVVYVALLAVTIANADFRLEIDQRERLRKITYAWRNKAKLIIEKIHKIGELAQRAAPSIRSRLSESQMYLRKMQEQSLYLIETISKVEEAEKLTAGEKQAQMRTTKSQLTQQIDKLDNGLDEITNNIVGVLAADAMDSSAQLTSINQNIKALSEGITAAKEELAQME